MSKKHLQRLLTNHIRDKNINGDIDIDCVESDRPAIFSYITDRFGADKTARVAAFGTLREKAVIDLVGKALAIEWEERNGAVQSKTKKRSSGNPYSLAAIDKIKSEFYSDEEATRKRYPEIFRYLDGLIGVKVSQSVHPAGMVISPITLPDNYGVFDKDGELCLMMDMDEAHEVGAAKYDFLALKTVKVIRDACNYIGIPYPKSHEVNWNDENVWNDIAVSCDGVFQFESPFAFECLKKYKPKNLFEMSLLTACIRPSGTSYRDNLLAREPNHNPSEMIDELLKDNNGYLVYQEDVIKFLQQICGLSGSEADNIRRAIGRKDKERLDKAMPKILEGYCSKSPKPRNEALCEAETFLKILEDSASYMFNYNHSIAYCMLSYLCAYFRYYHPIEFATAFMNNAMNNDDVQTGTALTKQYHIKMCLPKFGLSRAGYFFDAAKKEISKGVESVKYINAVIGDELYALSQEQTYDHFTDLLCCINDRTSADIRHIETLIKVDYFVDFGNQRELLRILDMFKGLKRGTTKKVKREQVDGTPLGDVIAKHSTCTTKDGEKASSYTITDMMAVLREGEDYIKSLKLPDLEDKLKVRNFSDIMGYSGYVTGKEEDRPKLIVKALYPIKRKKDGVQFGYSVITQSIGSGKESRFSVFNELFNKLPLKPGDLIYCKQFVRNGEYFTLKDYCYI